MGVEKDEQLSLKRKKNNNNMILTVIIKIKAKCYEDEVCKFRFCRFKKIL